MGKFDIFKRECLTCNEITLELKYGQYCDQYTCSNCGTKEKYDKFFKGKFTYPQKNTVETAYYNNGSDKLIVIFSGAKSPSKKTLYKSRIVKYADLYNNNVLAISDINQFFNPDSSYIKILDEILKELKFDYLNIT